jgi:hypothetical protein
VVWLECVNDLVNCASLVGLTRTSMGIAQRGSNRMMVKKREKDTRKRDADPSICEGHQGPIESKGPPPD